MRIDNKRSIKDVKFALLILIKAKLNQQKLIIVLIQIYSIKQLYKAKIKL